MQANARLRVAKQASESRKAAKREARENLINCLLLFSFSGWLAWPAVGRHFAPSLRLLATRFLRKLRRARLGRVALKEERWR